MNPDLQSAACIQTYSGQMFDVFHPDKDQIVLRDIAHPLSMLCRYGGHTRRFYSVAEHCVLMAQYFEFEEQYDLARFALLHDASEAYMGDVVRPVKLQMPMYRSVEVVLQHQILTKFGMPPELPQEVKMADLRICNDERAVLLEDRPWSPDIDNLPPLGVRIQCWDPSTAKREYTESFWRLFG